MTKRLRQGTSWTLRLLAAAILLQTLFFKFTGAEESIYIFSTLGIEPWGRLGTGVAELIAAILLLVPRTVVLGAGLSAGLLSGAIVSHLAVLGIVVMNDGGLLFGLAVTVFASALVLLALHADDVRRLAETARDAARANWAPR